jgi:hypothetical protein
VAAAYLLVAAFLALCSRKQDMAAEEPSETAPHPVTQTA